MSTPKQPPRKAASPPMVAPPMRLSPQLAALQNMLNGIAQSERMDQLVNYLHDLRREFDATAEELKAMGFCAPCYFSMLDNGDDHDCPEDDW